MTREQTIRYLSSSGFSMIQIDTIVKALEQEPVIDKIKNDMADIGEELRTRFDKISAEIWELYSYVEFDEDLKTSFNMVRLEEVQRVLDKYKAESEGEE